ncbi:hypothetical protein BBJ28_00016726 [Nothophytophthora sp. Chile5]|nr:hypothetical protein BBJ28_00016726 [Nothophytophthora sp. Chile5]
MYRVRETLLEDTALDYAEGCKRVHSVLTLFQRGNPTAHVATENSADKRFRRAFLSHPDVRILGETSQMVLRLVGAFLKHKGADNIMLILVGRNGNLENVILAVAICPSEDEDNCAWFVRCCESAGIGLSSLPIFSDRGSGIIAAASSLQLDLHYCTRHIIGNMKTKFRGQVTQYVENWMWSVQGAVSQSEFDSKIAAFSIGSPEIADYVRNIDPARWALHQYVLSKKLYGWRTTNFVKSENAKALHARGRNPTLFFQFFMEKWMQMKFKRFEQARKWADFGKRVTPKARWLMEEQAENARYHDISLINGDIGFVRDMRGSPPTRRRVNLRERKCTCLFFYQYGIPCSHICSMLAFINQPERVFDFFDRCYLVESYILGNDVVTSNIELVLDDEIQVDGDVQAPQGTRKLGRLKKKRIPSQGEMSEQRSTQKCSRCGHNRRTCRGQ